MRARLPAYDDALLRREMGLFPEWFCGRHLGLTLSGDEAAALAGVFDVLSATALEQPRVFVHRDYHSRNLMVGDGARHGRQSGHPGLSGCGLWTGDVRPRVVTARLLCRMAC